MSDDPLIEFSTDSLRFEQLLGKGAMGAVYRGTQVRLNRPVAIKVIAKHLAADAAYVERFNREAQTLGRLSHANVIACHDFGSITGPEGELLVMVLEYVDGWSLGSLAKEKRLSVRQVVELHRQAADGLHAANALNIVHRDIKPDNLMVTRQGQVKLADFGLAKADDSVLVTQTGAIVGSPAYMSPEAARGDEPGHLGDCYSLACSLFATLCGQPPFMSSSALNVLHQHVSSPIPSLRDKGRPDLAPLFDPFFSQALAKEPAQRHGGAQALAAALRQLANQVPPTLLAGAGQTSSGRLATADAVTATSNLATLATATPGPARPRPNHRRSGSQPRARAVRGRRSPIQLVVGLAALVLLLGVGLIAATTGGDTARATPPRSPEPRVQPTIAATPVATRPPPLVSSQPSPEPEPEALPAPAEPPTGAAQRLVEERQRIQAALGAVADLLRNQDLGEAERALAAVDVPEQLRFQDLRDLRDQLQDLILQRQGEALVQAELQLDQVEAALRAGDFTGARAILDQLVLPDHPRFERLRGRLFTGPIEPGAGGTAPTSGASGLQDNLLLQPGQLQGQLLYALDLAVPPCLPYLLEQQQVWRSGSDFSGRQVMVIELPQALPPERGSLCMIAHAGSQDRTLSIIDPVAGTSLSSGQLRAGAWRQLALDCSSHGSETRQLVLSSPGPEPFLVAQLGIGPSASTDVDLLTLRGGTLLPLPIDGPDSMEPLAQRLYAGTLGQWMPSQPTLIAPAPRDRAEAAALSTGLETAVTQVYTELLSGHPLLGIGIQPSIFNVRSAGEANREFEAALDRGVGLLGVLFETDGLPPGSLRNWNDVVASSLERGVLIVPLLLPSGNETGLNRSWQRSIDAIRSRDPWIPIIDLHRAVAFADELGRDWRQDPDLRRQLVLDGVAAGLHELLWRLSIWRPDPAGLVD